ncbi:2-oxo-4-hydroxy-4-carboxy-5-ureidoimidazoline decarboxylase [Acinetobacter bereziniae]|uniref:2-oxo-4-hydroxy-4-carboxy-5-ureidoimidazoline decarboxylase n=1 Tax=Acinetobacter bereziniae LMG 1003 = CIP 70.12 TaxID=981324 RepID=N9DFL7_ACIBZ|nr:2-oxo-4-hydroxy-4-carboxy-5-ureidoimidazoline decarboxylase [Acinetobacter bereziniae]ATZ63842.1 OHCU decarboxylase [Acinetobacter bereziniae]ENV96571.1 OHCU decarboxylase [Acinetobacter bereziniae LMG 1003 = CIP 70.12]MBJ9904154.1 2-oxo-4-hydroxy-4-carboxy-5-ureidoimidazoline decarboxylase [Acinetobacter bereziniae]MBJ9907693.1 2-oxo-4-hydroxy-4-carboxy-5-ureidoimidazoline decarboxylase [Acinetobacter bereziniae]MBJ9929124.1 2-oxo-4-hydroxy-4-carboxy-5-ureidoimidazoline decarboxylase [Acin
MNLNEFNQISKQQAQAMLNHCVQIPRWTQDIVSTRPFTSLDDLLDYAKKQALTWTWDEILTALNNHPRIGEKKAKANLTEQEREFSNREQSAIKHSSEVEDALLKGNLSYEKKFGFLFLIRALGLDHSEILQALKYRLLNDVETEQRIVKQQLSEIAILRLTQALSEH